MMMKKITLLMSLAIMVAATACAQAQSEPAKATNAPAETAKAPAPDSKEVAVIKTTAGQMVVEFWPEVAPKTVDNFKTLAKKGFYDGTAFHRIIKGFMIQGGDDNTKDPAKKAIYGQGTPGYTIKAEFNNRKHDLGVLSMARSSNPDSAGSQFFICLGRAPHLDGQYTAFGKVIKGEDVLVKIGETPVSPSPQGEPSVPITRVGVESIKIVPANSVK